MTATTSERQIDILDPRLYDDPWETYRWLRNNDPVYWDDTNKLWVISKYEDVSHISRHPETWCNKFGVRPVLDAPMSIIAMDDPEHTQQRRLINRGFTPRMVSKLADHVRELTIGIIESVAGKGQIDFVEDFAIHVPLIVIAELMGMPPEDRDKFFRWSDDMMAGDGHIDPESPVLQRAAAAFTEYVTYLLALFEEKKKNPQDDLISILMEHHAEGNLIKVGQGDEMKDDELLMFLVLLVVAGNETTRNAMSGGMLAFSENPDQRDLLVNDIDNQDLVNSAAEEVLRYVSPVISFSRTVVHDVTYKGREMKQGDKVLLLYQSANRDEDVFENPDVFDITRDPNPHIAFGIGPHFCLGANLARAEIRIVFQELFRRLPDIAAVNPGVTPRRGDSTLVIAIQELPTRFTPVG